MKELIESGKYKFHPIPAKDATGKSIPPQDYERLLKSAIVKITAVFKYQYLKGINNDKYYADVQEMEILRAAVIVDEKEGGKKRKPKDAVDEEPKGKKTHTEDT